MNEQLLSDQLIQKALTSFWKTKILTKFSDQHSSDKHIILNFRGVCSDSTLFTLGQMLRVNLNADSLEYIIKKLQTILSFKDDGYKSKSINSIIIQYGFVSGEAPT